MTGTHMAEGHTPPSPTTFFLPRFYSTQALLKAWSNYEQGLGRGHIWGVGITGRRVSDCGDMDPLKGLLIGVRLKPHVRNGKSAINTGFQK